MSIQNEIDRIANNVAEAYAAVEEKGGSVPEEANSDNLAEAVRSIPELEGIPVKPITKAEYSALSDEDKNGETAWLVTDAEGSGDYEDVGSSSDGSDIYSTEESRIGTWIDGKPLYRRGLQISDGQLSNLVSSSPTIVKELKWDTDSIVGFKTKMNLMNLTNFGPIYHEFTDYGFIATVEENLNGVCKIWIKHNESIYRDVYGAYIFLEYTKTTD